MNIYLASTYSNHPEMREWKETLAKAGYTVTSRWITGEDEPFEGTKNPEMNHTFATHDLEDLENSDIAIFDCRPETHGKGQGGRHVEFGFALCEEMPVIIIGEPENVFHYLNRVIVVKDLEEAITIIDEDERIWAGR